MRLGCMWTGVPFNEAEEFIELDGSILVLVDVVDHESDVLFGWLVTELFHNGVQFLRE